MNLKHSRHIKMKFIEILIVCAKQFYSQVHSLLNLACGPLCWLACWEWRPSYFFFSRGELLTLRDIERLHKKPKADKETRLATAMVNKLWWKCADLFKWKISLCIWNTDSGEFKKLSAFQKCKPDLLLAFWPNDAFDFLGGTDGQEGVCQEADQAKPTR